MINDLFQKVVSFSKRRGFIFPSSEIYGGFEGCYDFGPLGVEFKNNIKRAWWEEMTRVQSSLGKEIMGLDSSILMNPRVWEASGHLSVGFADVLVECKKCHKRFRQNEISDFKFEIGKCPDCEGEITKPRKFNLMMKTFVGAVEDEASVTYLRAETCQGIYLNFEHVLKSMRMKLPFGICQIGKSFRNEITLKNFIFRIREFEQMEMQWFCSPQIADEYFNYWKQERINWYLKLGLKKENLRAVEVPEKERAHYARRQVDIEYKFPFGWQEIEGIHNRGDWDLSNHSKYSGKDLRYFDQDSKKKYFPYVIETSAGVERSLFAFLIDAFEEIKGGRTKTTRSVKEVEFLLKLHKLLAPVKIAVLPLVRNKSELVKKSREIYEILKPHFACQYDELGTIGRRYRRQDEIGTIFCLTVDFESLKNDDLTLRDRDTMKQERIKIKDLIIFLNKKLNE